MRPKALPDWSTRLDNVVRQRMDWAFEWGKHDCALWGAACYEAVTGIDHASSLVGTYDSAFGARRVLAEFGGLRGLLESRLGPPCLDQWEATPGDIGLVETPNGPCVALCAGAHWLAPGVNGLQQLRREDAIAAWKVV